jgi:Domain of unknown function (DUF1963)
MYTDVSEMLLLTPGIGTPLKLIRPAFQDAIPLDIAYFGETDRTLLRQGFIVVGDAVIANGSVSSCMRLWTRHPVVPAYRPDQMLVVRDIADGSFVVELTDGNCDVINTLQTNATRVIGQLASGEVVTETDVLSWDGQSRLLDSFGHPIGLLAGRYLISLHSTSVLTTDLRDGSRVDHPVKFNPGSDRPIYNHDATCLLLCEEFDGALVVTTEAVHQHQFDLVCVDAVWGPENDPMFVLEDLAMPGVDTFVVRRSQGVETSWTNSSDQRPVLDVTGRMSAPDAVANQQAVVVVGVLPFDVRDDMAGRAAARFESAADEADVDVELLMSIVAPTIAFRLAVAESDTDIPVGGSHFGGQPDVPDSFEWMTFQGRPYAFLAQLRCDELRSASAGSYLPSGGWVLLFVDLNKRGTGTDDQYALQVVHLEDQAVARRAFPEELTHRFPPSWVGMVPSLSLPPWEDLLDTFDFDAAEVLIDATRSAWPDHRIFGHPDLRFADENRSFLLKIAADEALGVWAGNGWLNVDMPEGVELVAALEDCQVQTLGGHPGV